LFSDLRYSLNIDRDLNTP